MTALHQDSESRGGTIKAFNLSRDYQEEKTHMSGLRSEDRGKGAGGVRQQSERSLLSQHLVPYNILLLEHSPLQEILNDSSVPKPLQSRHHVIHQAEQVHALHDSQRFCQDVHLEVQHGLREDG